MNTAVQMYTLRTLDEPLVRTLERVAETPLDGAEIGADGAADPDVQAALEELNLGVPTVGAGFDDLEAPEEGLVDACRALGVDRVVLGYLGPDHFESADAAEETAELVSGFVETLADYDLELLYHNHAHEFVEIGDGQTAFDVFLAHVDDRLQFELDVGWVGTGGQDPATVLADLGDRTPIIHVKDMHFDGEADFADLGEGDLDLEEVLPVAFDQGVEWAIYEHDEPDDPIAALERDSQILVDAVEVARADRSD
ncbi:sugar phosphate isomerase/epimerase [Halobacteria archaeon AArc-m2/3/4]|uniref:Sugar phosphate isomerase/epimerase n=1 Tax=Natronoglomus mannanivorans TaxID=2979990 RepID=A0AAP3E1Q1_9EURY|nr:sugar phosphate isomerase/epimerase [Halobacteria archaeon AArc-xg1-1]MCU4972311.1 sugar phosphate isomerase/epimerase [Halobacteria archaeon AArc-m2/3/4]